MASATVDDPTRAASKEAPPSPPWLRRHRRGAILAAVALLVILAAAVAGASWHFSSAVLVPDHSDRPADVTVDGLSPGRVVLSRSEDTLRPGVYGLDWQTGHAIVGEVLGNDAGTVTRQLRVEGGYLVRGMKVALDPDVYAGEPSQALGLPSSDVLVPGELGPMPAWFIPGRTNTWAIVIHGINRNPEAGLRMAPTLHRDGLPSLLITYREDLGAPRSPDGLHHMGLTEWRDLAAAARYALSHGARRLVLVGYSMGGAIVTQFMERSPLAARVAGLVLDSPALSWKAILSFSATEMGLPSFAANPVEWMIGARIDADWQSLDALRHPGAFHLPILLFHGTEDKIVPIATSDEFARELSRWVTYYRVPKAGHTEAWNVAPGPYERRLTAFLSRVGATAAP
ncbi:MAG TPA: alpha/beta fold hydrolase [Solirubrobacteraceae bacterium]|nr:alpha/beta fold hydrolase [Solirubrobacteraceae bacterium]